MDKQSCESKEEEVISVEIGIGVPEGQFSAFHYRQNFIIY